ncbi:hypothetical protein PFISCL1PPCAC_8511 [Pristionchus fissidentatus]|uniref:Carboxylesterase type B domain-containing protein n=1 Tax=Pristionchus fissidentatus TaxID=1538716 RepID=A0AAV5VH91_9BILA|nr:hypothetical protein PFISCL1PPCAC_8511 [Pristionchus fissidentatus]
MGETLPEDKDVMLRKIANPVFFYIFEHHNPTVMGFLGKQFPIQDVTHACELFYLFNKGLVSKPTPVPGDAEVTDQFTTAFTNFAKYGNPNGPDEDKTDLHVYWKPLDNLNHNRNLVFATNGPRMDEQFFEGRVAKYLEIIEKHRD